MILRKLDVGMTENEIQPLFNIQISGQKGIKTDVKKSLNHYKNIGENFLDIGLGNKNIISKTVNNNYNRYMRLH